MPFVPLVLTALKLEVDEFVGWLEGGEELAYAEFKVDDDFRDCTVVLDSVEESVVPKLAFDRRRKSRKKGITFPCW